MLAGALALAGFSASAADDEIVVAVVGPMTGQYAAFGKAMLRGAGFAVGTIMKRGGVDGKPIRLVVEDDACDRTQAIEAGKRLVSQRVALVVGHHCASASIAAAPIYAAAGIVMISPGTTDPQLTDKRAGATIFRLAPRDDAEGGVSGAYLARVFAGRRIAILHDRTAANIKLAETTRAAARAAGLVEVLYSGFIAGETDYGRLSRDLRGARIEAVYLGAYPSEVALILAALRSDGQTMEVVTGHLLAAPADVHERKRREGLLVTALADFGGLADPARLPPDSPGFAERRLKSNTVAALEAWAAAATGSASSTVTAERLRSLALPTALGEIRFDKKGDAEIPFFAVHRWNDGVLRPVP